MKSNNCAAIEKNDDAPDVSVITVTYNSIKTIERTILSVIEQESVKIEFIVVDGGSSDGTADIINKYSSWISHYISEPDGGIYDAMNKGLRVAKGKWIAILNSDDYYTSNKSLYEICKLPDGVSAAASDVVIRTNEGDKLFRISHKRKRYINIPYMHTGVFIRNCVYKNTLGYFDLKYKIASDVDLILRALKRGVRFFEIEKPLVVMSDGGASSKHFYRGRLEYAICYIKHDRSIVLAVIGLVVTSVEFFLYHSPLIRSAVRRLKKI